MPVSVRSRRGPHGLSTARLRTRALRMLLALGRPDHELSVLLVDDATMASLNETYRGRKGSTDVLSFSMGEGEHGDVNPNVLGDVVICVPKARAQAARARRDPFDEVTMLLAHGLLHLTGQDHRTSREGRVMKTETRRLVRAASMRKAVTSRT